MPYEVLLVVGPLALCVAEGICQLFTPTYTHEDETEVADDGR